VDRAGRARAAPAPAAPAGRAAPSGTSGASGDGGHCVDSGAPKICNERESTTTANGATRLRRRRVPARRPRCVPADPRRAWSATVFSSPRRPTHLPHGLRKPRKRRRRDPLRREQLYVRVHAVDQRVQHRRVHAQVRRAHVRREHRVDLRKWGLYRARDAGADGGEHVRRGRSAPPPPASCSAASSLVAQTAGAAPLPPARLCSAEGAPGGGSCVPARVVSTAIPACVSHPGAIACPAGYSSQYFAGSQISDGRSCFGVHVRRRKACGGSLRLYGRAERARARPIFASTINGACAAVPRTSRSRRTTSRSIPRNGLRPSPRRRR